MRRHTVAAVLLATGLALAGCTVEPPAGASDSAPASSPSAASPAQKLADLDGGGRPVGQYQMALDRWAARCKEGPSALAGYVYATVADLQKNGIDDETEYSTLVHLKDSTPAGMKTRCEDVAAGYLVLREGGKS